MRNAMNRTDQLELITYPPHLYRTLLEATDSPRRAYYEVTVYHIPNVGYLIQKASGGQSAKPNVETWFRPNLRQALEKKAQLIYAKLHRKAIGRMYSVAGGE